MESAKGLENRGNQQSAPIDQKHQTNPSTNLTSGNTDNVYARHSRSQTHSSSNEQLSKPSLNNSDDDIKSRSVISTINSNRPNNLNIGERFQLYTVIHKYIRVEINNITKLAGSCDFLNRNQYENFVSEFKKLVTTLDNHAEREDTHFHPLLKNINSDLLDPLEKEHSHLDAMVKSLQKELTNIKTRDDSHRFYLNLLQFQTAYFNHLDNEETQIMPELHAHFDDTKLRQVNGQLLQTIPRDENVAVMKKMLPVLNHQERVEIFLAMKKAVDFNKMPPMALTNMCRLAQTSLSEYQADRLFKAIDVNESTLVETLNNTKSTDHSDYRLLYFGIVVSLIAILAWKFDLNPWRSN